MVRDPTPRGAGLGASPGSDAVKLLRNLEALFAHLVHPSALRAAQGLDSQALPAFGAPCIQHLAPSAGGHPRPKTVRALPLDAARLVGAFHDASVKMRVPDARPAALAAFTEGPGGRERDCRERSAPSSIRNRLTL